MLFSSRLKIALTPNLPLVLFLRTLLPLKPAHSSIRRRLVDLESDAQGMNAARSSSKCEFITVLLNCDT